MSYSNLMEGDVQNPMAPWTREWYVYYGGERRQCTILNKVSDLTGSGYVVSLRICRRLNQDCILRLGWTWLIGLVCAA